MLEADISQSISGWSGIVNATYFHKNDASLSETVLETPLILPMARKKVYYRI